MLRWLPVPIWPLPRWVRRGNIWPAPSLVPWSLRDGGAIAWVSGVAMPTLNGVWAERADPDRDAVAALLDRVKAVGLPYCL